MKITGLVFVTLWLSLSSCAQSIAQIWLEETTIEAVAITTGLEVPWSMAAWGDDAILLTERAGKIKRVNLATGQIKLLYVASDIAVEGQAGLLGVQTHPQFPDTPLVYVANTYYQNASIFMRIDRLKYSEIADSLEFDQTIVSDLPSGNSNTGGRLFIDSDQKLWLTLGDIKDTDLPQDQLSVNGKVLRFELNGSPASENPISGSPIYSSGHRNPQGITETNSGEMYISEHGPSSDDELNLLQGGGNYGWPLVTGSCEGNEEICDSLSIEEPLYTWSPTIAPAGIAYYNGSQIPEWTNSIIIAALKDQRLSIAHLSEDQTEVNSVSTAFTDNFGRIRDVLVIDERIFLCTSNRDALGESKPDDDFLIELIPSAHNGINKTDQNALVAFYNDGYIYFKYPVSSTVQIINVMGQVVAEVEMKNEVSLSINGQITGMVFIRDVRTNRVSKLIIE